METSIFDQIGSALTVQSICSTLGPDIPAGSTLDELETLPTDGDILKFLNYPSRIVEENGDVKGIIWCGNLDFLEQESNLVDDHAEHLEPHELLSSSTTVLDAVELFGTKENRYFYVIQRNEIVGVLFYRDLFKPLGRLAFLSLALEIEDTALKLCQTPENSERCWNSLSDNRKRKALELFNARYKREPFGKENKLQRAIRFETDKSDVQLLIECTNLIDKATMIWNESLIASANLKSVLGFFHELQTVRDRCAHPGGKEELLPKDRLAHFVQSAKQMRNSLREAWQNSDGGEV